MNPRDAAKKTPRQMRSAAAKPNPLDALKDRAAALGRPLSAGDGMSLLVADAAGQSDLQGHAFAAMTRGAAKPTIATLTPAQREALNPLIIRAAFAAMGQSKAEAAYEKATAVRSPTHAEQDRAMRAGGKAEDAQRETCAAGAALAAALRKVTP